MWCSFDRIDVMLTKYGYENRGLFMKDFKEMTGDYRVCGEVTFFWKNTGMGALCFLEIGRILDKIWSSEHKSRESQIGSAGRPELS